MPLHKTTLTLVLAFGPSLGPSFGHAAASEKRAIEEIVVIAHPLSGEGLSQASDVLQGRELQRKLSGNIGATLAQQPGIHSAAFGNAVGRPVIQGLGGPRVRVMEDRIDALDLSVTSADHAVTIEPFIAERIEVLKGPSALLYGSGAIGGVVDVHTARIPHHLPDEMVNGGVETRFDNNTDGNTTAAKLNGRAGRIAWHLDGTRKDGDDYRIPGFTESARLRALEAAEADADGDADGDADDDEVRGRLPGSAFDAQSFAGGASYIADWGFVGVSLGRLEADYGLPGGHEHEHDEGDDADAEPEGAVPMLELEQTRLDFELGIENPFAFFSSANVRLGINDYEHQEIEPNGEIATDFGNEAWELRGELVYDLERWSGAVGLQVTEREFSAIGEEAFVPPVDTRESGLFWLAQRDLGAWELETGLRLGRVEHDPSVGRNRSFDNYAASVGLVIPWRQSWQLGLTAGYSVRAPVAEELYSNGPHLVTGTFEFGDASLDNERAASVSGTLQYQGARWQAAATAYVRHFSDFIYAVGTGAVEDDLPVFQFRQDDTRFVGFEAEASAQLATWRGGQLQLRGLVDWVDARLQVSGNRDLPRMPPLRLGVGVEVQQGRLTGSIDYQRFTDQRDTAELELVSDGYDDLRAYVGILVPVADSELEVFLNGRNLTDDEQRVHTSYIKDVAPSPGRTLELGLRVVF